MFNFFNTNYKIYSNQIIPLHIKCNIEEKIKIDGELSNYFTGGSITHLNITDKMQHPNQMKEILQYAIKYGCEHLAVNYSFNECINEYCKKPSPVRKMRTSKYTGYGVDLSAGVF